MQTVLLSHPLGRTFFEWQVRPPSAAAAASVLHTRPMDPPPHAAVNGNGFFSFFCRPGALTGSSLVEALSSGALGEVPTARN